MASIKQILFGINIVLFIFALIIGAIFVASAPIVGIFLYTLVNVPWLIINWFLIHRFYKDETQVHNVINELIIEKQVKSVLGEIKIE